MSLPPIAVTHFSDPGCPWAYSASPALRVLEWRYGDALDWRLVMIGLTERSEQYVARGYTPERGALGQLMFRRFGMPFAPLPKEHVAGTSPACRVIVATRLKAPEREEAVFRALQFAQFTSPLMLDVPDDLRQAIAGVSGIDADAIVGAIEDDDVWAAYEADRAAARRAEGGPTEAQGKAAQSDGPVRFTAPSLLFDDGGRTLEAGGFQPVEAYDVCLANLDPTLPRRPPPEDPSELLDAFPHGLTTQEVAALMTSGNDAPDRTEAEVALIALAARGGARRTPLGDDALWTAC